MLIEIKAEVEKEEQIKVNTKDKKVTWFGKTAYPKCDISLAPDSTDDSPLFM